MGEDQVWEGRPSAVLLFGTFFKSLLFFWIPAVIGLAILTGKMGVQLDGTDPRRLWGALAILWFLLPFPYLLGRWIALKCRKYELTTERLTLSTGVLSRRIDSMELYRVKDITLDVPFFLRLFGRANVLLETSDKTTPRLLVEAIPDARAVSDKIRAHVEAMRDRKRAREVDMELGHDHD